MNDKPSDIVRLAFRTTRRRRGLTQTALAARLGIRQSKVAKMELGETRFTFDEALEWAQALRDPATLSELHERKPRSARRATP